MQALKLTDGTNGTPTRMTRRPARRSTRPAAAAAPQDHLRLYATAGVALMAVLSALLNAYANGQHATVPWAGWAMGLAVPAIVLTLGKVAGLLWRRGRRPLAYLTGGTGAGLLFLSVWHCATSIALLTGSPLLLALPMAVAVDCGLVCLEIAALVD